MARRAMSQEQRPGDRRTPSGTGSGSIQGEGASHFGGWERRIYAGVQLPGVPADVRQSLARALGAVGVEAEHFLELLAAFPGPEGPSPERGARFLDQLQAFAQRLIGGANALELATQSYLTALEAAGQLSGVGAAEPWWPTFSGYTVGGEPMELRLRRCGYSYREAVLARLGPTVEAIGEQMALFLHALSTLPPAGILSAPVVAQGLDDLTDAMQGDVVPHLIRDVSDDFPGLLSAIERLRASGSPGGAAEAASLAADLAWARTEYERVIAATPATSAKSTRPGLFARLFGASPRLNATERWSQSAAHEWRELIAALEALQGEQPRRPSAGAP